MAKKNEMYITICNYCNGNAGSDERDSYSECPYCKRGDIITLSYNEWVEKLKSEEQING